MNTLVARLPELVAPLAMVTTPVTAWLNTPANIGFIVLAIIVGPVLIITLTAMLEQSAVSRLPRLFASSVVLLIGATIAGFAMVGVVLKFVIPQ
ncbi:MAG: hypothetical protein HW402_212 [Dehalococcoidales bacterium]|nr:hypothetical protein [Dehalococcoidales bacterium]